MYEAAAFAGCDGATLTTKAPRLDEIPFDSKRKLMTTLHREGGEVMAYIKGAPESVLARCISQWTLAGFAPIDTEALLKIAERMAAEGLRVLALAYRAWPELPKGLSPETMERDLRFLGFVGLMDPPRPEALEAGYPSAAPPASLWCRSLAGWHTDPDRSASRRVAAPAPARCSREPPPLRLDMRCVAFE